MTTENLIRAEGRYFLGVDVGATKSHGLIATESGQVVGFGQAGPGNHESIGWEGTRQVLQQVTERALLSAGLEKNQLAAAGIGMGGYDWPEDRAPARQVFATLKLAVPFEFVNDTLIGLLAGATEGWGVAVVAGTGSNCWGRDRSGRRAGRVTGEGARFAEHGGGGDLVARAVQAVSLAWSRRGPDTQLSAAFLEETGATDVTDLLAGLARQRYKLSAKQAPLVFRIATEGDRVAQELIQRAGQDLGDLACGVIRQLGFEAESFEVVLVGSLYHGSTILAETMQEVIQTVAPRARLVRLRTPPVVGGVLLAMQQVGLEIGAVRPALLASATAFLDEGSVVTNKLVRGA